MMYTILLECNINHWYSANSLSIVGRYWIMYRIQWMVAKVDGQPNFIWSNMKDVPSASHLPNTYCQPHQLPSLHTLSANWSSLQHTPSAAPSAPPPHCWLTGHHSNLPCQLTGSHSNPTIGQPHYWPTGHHSNIHCWPPHCWPTVSHITSSRLSNKPGYMILIGAPC